MFCGPSNKEHAAILRKLYVSKLDDFQNITGRLLQKPTPYKQII